MDIQSIEGRILEEYNWLHAQIALHPYAAVGIAFALGLGIGWLL
jgi:ElaB/YqjD/DUF883 family membrane-anchored ribosome-binding protein